MVQNNVANFWLLLRSHRCQFHHHFTCAFFIWKCFVQLFSSFVLASGKEFWKKKTILYEKRVRKMLIKLTTVLVINDFGLLFVLKVANLLSFGASKAVVWKSSFKLVKVQFDPVIWRIFNSIVIENGAISAIIWVFKIYLHQTVRDICICICTWKFFKLAFIHLKS